MTTTENYYKFKYQIFKDNGEMNEIHMCVNAEGTKNTGDLTSKSDRFSCILDQ